MAEYGEPLSERELEILQLVATGVTNKEVAHRLGISVNTVKVHLRNIFAKLGAESRTEATMIAVQKGWVVIPQAEAPPPQAVEAAPEPPLPLRNRVVLLVAALLAIAGGVLSWPRPSPASAPAGPLPLGGGGGEGQRVGPEEGSQWTERAQMPTRRAWLGLAAYAGRLYAIGGEGPDGVTGAVEIYNPSTDTWGRGTAKPTPVAYVGAAALGDRIFVPGGCMEGGEPLDVVEVYRPAADAWEEAFPLPRPLCAYALAVYEGRLYLFGGTDGETYLVSTYVYLPEEDRWEERAPMPQPRALAAAAALEGRIYVVGGYRAGRELTTCAVYEPEKDTWSVCAPLTMARGGLGLIALGGQLYAIGGGGWGGYLGFSERYTPAEDRWTAAETPLTGSWRGAGTALLDLVAYAVGGYGDDYLSLTLAFEPLPFRIFIPATEG
ncbi:MAG TPA: helix-turn-helix domain-containing protein [Chloroflexi bacterium]|nr:helix-turn-helix domain-containing protein [Chloroflexota bacterium]